MTSPWLAWLITADLAVKTVKVRRRLRALPVLPANAADPPPRAEPVDGWCVVTAAGVTLDRATRHAAVEHARLHRLRAVDLVPADLHTEPVIGLFKFADPRTYHAVHGARRKHRGLSAGHAVVVSGELADHAAVAPSADLDPIAFIEVVMRLHRYAPGATKMALAPGLAAVPYALAARRASLRALKVPVWLVLLMQFGEIAGFAGALNAHPLWGLLPLGLFWLQAYLIRAGRSPVRPADLHRAVAIRPAWTVWAFLRTLFGRSKRTYVPAGRPPTLIPLEGTHAQRP